LRVVGDNALTLDDDPVSVEELENSLGKDKAQGNTASIKVYAPSDVDMNFMGTLFEMAQKYDRMTEVVIGNER